MGMVLELIDWRSEEIIYFFWTPPQEGYSENNKKINVFRFCKTRSRETRGESILELFPTTPTYQNPININLGPVLCKVS